jgi:hypothetical protein
MFETIEMNTTAILVFANSSKEELKHKAMPKGSVLFDGLTEHAMCTAKKTGLPYFLLTEKEQHGNSFGERFVNAVRSIFDMGFDNVITIGNDTPELKVADILKAWRLVCAKKFVLGSSKDGGFYLMGLTKTQFDDRAFKNLPWKTNALSKKITDLIKLSNTDIIRLRTLLDLDDYSDLKRLLNGFRAVTAKIIKAIFSLLAPAKKIVQHLHFLTSFLFENSFFNKGSPVQMTIQS